MPLKVTCKAFWSNRFIASTEAGYYALPAIYHPTGRSSVISFEKTNISLGLGRWMLVTGLTGVALSLDGVMNVFAAGGLLLTRN